MRTLVVVGNGPVAFSFLEFLSQESNHGFRVIAISEERRPAYNRVQMTSYFGHRSAEELLLVDSAWYPANRIELLYGTATRIDRKLKQVLVETDGMCKLVDYDELVLVTGSRPFIPQAPGLETCVPGVFVYRTIEDMEAIVARAANSRHAAVIGGGLLGLEAAKAMVDLQLDAHVIEAAPQLMMAQLDYEAGRLLKRKIEALGVKVHTGMVIREVLVGENGVSGVHVACGGEEFIMEAELIVISCGIRPRDELARQCGLDVGPRGGVKVDSSMRSVSDAHIYAIGEVASFEGIVYGLWQPGVEQAKVLVATLAKPNLHLEYRGSDLSTKLKLLGVEVASFGVEASFWTQRILDCNSRPGAGQFLCAMVASDPSRGTYRKLVFERKPTGGRRLIGGVLVGNAADYSALMQLLKDQRELWGLEAEVLAHGNGGSTPMLIEESVYPASRM